jgi:hypothetical protein
MAAPCSGANKIISDNSDFSQYPWPNMENSSIEKKDPYRNYAMAPIGFRTLIASGEKVLEN